MLARETLEDGRKIKQKQIKEQERLEEIKKEKIDQLKAMGVKDKYITSLQKYKITYK